MEKTTLIGLLLIACLPVFAQQEELSVVEFYPQGGFYANTVEVELLAPDATIHYTLDGTTPTRRSEKYKKPLKLETTSTLRAVAYHQGKAGKLYAHTYFIKEPETNFPVVSIGITPRILFDPGKGMFMQGNQLVGDSWKMPGANFWTRQEVPIHVEIFESNGRCVYNSLSGFRLFGGMSRLFPQKSMTLVARERYGEKQFDYPIFGEKGEKDFKFWYCEIQAAIGGRRISAML
ncbi:MAG: chitobiase/beta-hexosaminidase C-terminal domain-containing protein [Saprospiraceae bacterium]|nr:chitobiase/beta-hexosaminidase C-terminal domain-containing protein [Saprospiraceae bacterium]